MDSDAQLLSPYAPIRYRTIGWWEFARFTAKQGFVTPAGQIAAGLPDLIMERLISPLSTQMAELIKPMPEAGQLMGNFLSTAMELRHWVPLAAQYELCGRQIFDLTDELVEMLAVTDIGDATLEGWHAPFNSFFVRLGRQESMRIPWENDFEYLDGAFVGVTPWDDTDHTRCRIKFGFTTVKPDGSGMTLPGYFVDLTPDEQLLPIAEAIDASIARRVAAFSSPDDGEQAQALSQHRQERLRDGAALMKQALTLVVNALFYIESTSNKGRSESVEPGRDTRPELMVAWSQASPQKQQKLRSKLTSDGYAIVHMIGKEVLRSHSPHKEAAGKKTHWRRGHWRQQKHGPNLSHVKRLWIKPVMINQDRPHDDMPGHIYVFGSDNKH